MTYDFMAYSGAIWKLMRETDAELKVATEACQWRSVKRLEARKKALTDAYNAVRVVEVQQTPALVEQMSGRAAA